MPSFDNQKNVKYTTHNFWGWGGGGGGGGGGYAWGYFKKVLNKFKYAFKELYVKTEFDDNKNIWWVKIKHFIGP